MSRDFLCASCVDYLIAYHPLWLNPALLPGPSLLDYVSPREVPLVSADLAQIEWETPRESRATDAVRLIRLLNLNEGANPILSVGDADLLHAFLREARRSTPGNPEQRNALATICLYLSTCDWMPPHLAVEYRLRANALTGPVAEAPRDVATVEERVRDVEAPPTPLPESKPAEEERSEPLPALPEMDFDLEDEEVPLPAPGPFPPEPIPEPEPPIPLPEPPAPEPEPQPEPEPEPEEARVDVARWTEFEAMLHALERERMEIEPSARSRSESAAPTPTPAPDFHTFVESIEPDQEEVHVLLQLAELALEGGDASMALLRYEQALQREDRNPDAWTGKGVALQQLERYREALEAYNRALSLKPDHALAQKWRATCLRHLEAEGSE
ncbi:MAG: tetratricopeptide repeat protein [Thermoplasmata archaeon]